MWFLRLFIRQLFFILYNNPLYNNILTSSNGTIQWAVNFNTNRNAVLTGFDAGTFGAAIVLAYEGNSLTSSNASGYALTYGGTAARNFRLVRFTNGLVANANLTNIVNNTGVTFAGK